MSYTRNMFLIADINILVRNIYVSVYRNNSISQCFSYQPFFMKPSCDVIASPFPDEKQPLFELRVLKAGRAGSGWNLTIYKNNQNKMQVLFDKFFSSAGGDAALPRRLCASGEVSDGRCFI